MRAAGMTVRRDAIGNVIGRREAVRDGAPTLLLGSHLDTVRDAGRYDGMLGVLVAIACVERAGALPYAIEVLGFADEEGVRYGTAYLGSSVVAGRFDRSHLGRHDADGIAMADAIGAFGGDVDGLAVAARDPAGLVGYCEVHIEQGPVLEAAGLPVGVVSSIAGQTRAAVTFAGAAGHAGTVPMRLRRDALCAAAEWIVAVEAQARAAAGVVATVGELHAEPGAEQRDPGPRGALARPAPCRRRHARGRLRALARARRRDRGRP